MGKSFKDFHNLYSLNKTLRFELLPVGNTEKMLEEEQVINKDKLVQEKYVETKRYIDKLHQDFAKRSLTNIELEDLDVYMKILNEQQNDNKNKEKQNRLDKAETKLRKQIVKEFDEQAYDWISTYTNIKIKKKDIGALFEVSVFSLLKELYGDQEDTLIYDEVKKTKVSIFDDWDKFTGYFNKLYENRKNFYKDEGKAGSHATRIIDQNLKRFCNNINKLLQIKDKIDFSEVEENFNIKLDDTFTPNFYNKCLAQDGIDFYNQILGGKTLENGEKLKGINEFINQYRQQNKGVKIPFLSPLDKQILSEKEVFITAIENKDELVERLQEHLNECENRANAFHNLLENFVGNESKYNLENIYISKIGLNTISHSWVDDLSKFHEILYETMKTDKPQGLSYNSKEQSYSFPEAISLGYIKEALNSLEEGYIIWKEKYREKINEDYSNWEQFVQIYQLEFTDIFTKYKDSKEKLKEVLNAKEDIELDRETKNNIKSYLDNSLFLYQLAKYFTIEKKRRWLEEFELDIFYTDPEQGYKTNFYDDAYEFFVQYYNQFRNYLTKKLEDEAGKWKLNFENATLAHGWDKNKERDNYAIILQRDEAYYLAVMKKGFNKTFAEENKVEYTPKSNEELYEKMVYKYLPDAAKGIPKCSTQLNAVKKHFAEDNSDYILDGDNFSEPFTITKKEYDLNNLYHDKEDIQRTFRDYEDDKKNGIKKWQKDFLRISNDEKEYKQAVTEWIEFSKRFLKTYEGTKIYNWEKLKETKDYNSVDEFYKHVNDLAYNLSFENISGNYIKTKNDNGELYLFQIYNKDFAKGSTGKPNLHTLYFKNIFSEENKTQNFPIKLDGQAELFYRPQALKEIRKEKRNNPREITYKKRYTENKIFFHCPVTLNRNKQMNKFDSEMNKCLANNKEINVIGIDRGEKHLAYYSVINQKGEVLDSGSFNKIHNIKKDGSKISKDYKTLLDEKEKERLEGRKSWDTIEQIKDLKKGYMSHVIRKIADLAIEHNAIIVLEDLNMRFKQIRGGIEKSVYQQLEKALIEKLNFVVNKQETDVNQTGHVLKAYQLTAPIDSFKNMGKQTGIIFYTQASYTSKIDPLTGWRPNLYLKYHSAQKAKEDINRFTTIFYNDQKDQFEFTYDLKNFQNLKEFPKKTTWILGSKVQRFRWNKNLNANQGGYEEYSDMTQNLKELFSEYNINYKEKDIKEEINKIEPKGNEKFFKSFIFYWTLICQIRNTDEKAKNDYEQDFILSPVEPYFNSRNAQEFGKNLPGNGDENGAYNIARKGIILLDKISKNPEVKWGELYIPHSEWDNFAQK